MNNVQLIGRLTKDPDLKYTSGKDPMAVARFNLAVDDGYGENKRTSFIPIVVFGKQAESCETYLKKGSQAAVTGRIQTGSYEKDGRTIYTTDVVANRVEFLNSVKAKSNDDVKPADDGDETPEGFMAGLDDIPF